MLNRLRTLINVSRRHADVLFRPRWWEFVLTGKYRYP